MPATTPDLGLDPLDAVERWPSSAPLAALVSCDLHPQWSRWSILASPTDFVGIDATEPAPIERLREALGEPTTPAAHRDDPPFAGGWLVALAYHLGGAIEPRAARAGAPSPEAPAAALLRCPGAYVHDRVTGAWRIVGDARALPTLESEPGVRAWAAGPFGSDADEAAYRAMVERALVYIGAGDVYQVNLTRRLRAPFEGDPRAMFARVARAMGAWCAGYMEIPGAGSVVSFSPELLFELRADTRRVVTRPIKGTQLASAPPDELLASAKDAAELAMIVDLMRNDLGRVCDFGSVRVEAARALERHGGRGGIASSAVRHAVATISATLSPKRDIADLIGAIFPAGSVTGAPKIRAMQIIDELERSPREWYCGSLGFVSDAGDAACNVAIRSGWIRPDAGTIDYHIGAGIVADSDPAAEWRETGAKAAGFLRAAGAPAPASAGAGA